MMKIADLVTETFTNSSSPLGLATKIKCNEDANTTFSLLQMQKNGQQLFINDNITINALQKDQNDQPPNLIHSHKFTIKNKKLSFNQQKLVFDHHPYIVKRLNTFHNLYNHQSYYHQNGIHKLVGESSHVDSHEHKIIQLRLLLEDFTDIIGLLSEESDLVEGNKLATKLAQILFPPRPELIEQQQTFSPPDECMYTGIASKDYLKVLCDMVERCCNVVVYPLNTKMWRAKKEFIPSQFSHLITNRIRERETILLEFNEYFSMLTQEQKLSFQKHPPNSKRNHQQTLNLECSMSFADDGVSEVPVHGKDESTIEGNMEGENLPNQLQKKHPGFSCLSPAKQRKTPTLSSNSSKVPKKIPLDSHFIFDNNSPSKQHVSSASASSLSNGGNGQKRVSQFFSFIQRKEEEKPLAQLAPFDELFKPFFIKQHVTMAPINRFNTIAVNVISNENGSFSSSIQDKQEPQISISISNLNEQLFSRQKFKFPFKKHRFGPVKSVGRVMGAVEGVLIVKFKLFQFHDNYRPAYYGTFRKPRPLKVNPRNPFNMADSSFIDYSIDSDEEWEEEELGDVEIIQSESDNDSAGENVSSNERNDYCCEDSEDDFMVPDGYVSNNEGEDIDRPACSSNPCSKLNINKNNSMPIAANQHINTSNNHQRRNFSLVLPPTIVSYLQPFNQEPRPAHNITVIYYETPDMPTDPFVPLRTNQEKLAKSTRQLFPSQHLPLLTRILLNEQNVNENIKKIYSLFISQLPPQISAIGSHSTNRIGKRCFEEKLNEIAFKEKYVSNSSGNGRAKWKLKPEYLSALASSQISTQVSVQTTENSISGGCKQEAVNTSETIIE